MVTNSYNQLGCVVVYVCMMREIHYGIGRHSDDPVIKKNNSQISFWSFIRAIFLVFSISGTKISVGYFLLRVVDGTKYRRYIQGMIGELPTVCGSNVALTNLSHSLPRSFYSCMYRHSHLPVYPSQSSMGLQLAQERKVLQHRYLPRHRTLQRR